MIKTDDGEWVTAKIHTIYADPDGDSKKDRLRIVFKKTPMDRHRVTISAMRYGKNLMPKEFFVVPESH